jgi:hypothetical protein
MLGAGFEPAVPVYGRSEAMSALDRATIVIACSGFHQELLCYEKFVVFTAVRMIMMMGFGAV